MTYRGGRLLQQLAMTGNLNLSGTVEPDFVISCPPGTPEAPAQSLQSPPDEVERGPSRPAHNSGIAGTVPSLSLIRDCDTAALGSR